MKYKIEDSGKRGWLLLVPLFSLFYTLPLFAANNVNCQQDQTDPVCIQSCIDESGQKNWCDDLCAASSDIDADGYTWCDDLCATDPNESWCSTSGTGSGADLGLENAPLFLGGYADPNIVFTLDDSGSMEWEMMPEEVRPAYRYLLFPVPDHFNNPVYNGASNYNDDLPDWDDNNPLNYYLRSNYNNKIFFDPSVTYEPWKYSNGNSYPDINPAAALYNPYNAGVGTINLLTNMQTFQNVDFMRDDGDGDLTDWTTDSDVDNEQFWPITYYIFNGGSGADVKVRSNYTRIQVREEAGGVPVTFGGTTYSLKLYKDATEVSGITENEMTAHVQNFANWFSYYRSRILLSRAAASQAFSSLPETFRVGFAAINSTATPSINGLYNSPGSLVSGVEPFTGTARTSFFDNMFGNFSSGGTPLLPAMERVGDYFDYKTGDFADLGPWASTPSVDDDEGAVGDLEVCRRSYNIMMTDGYWNSAYGANGNTLAEIATNYYVNDLQPGIPGEMDMFSILDEDGDGDKSVNDLDEDFDDYGDDGETDPHLTVFSVALGVTGTLPIPALDGDLDSIAWPAVCALGSSCPEKIDDMLHAAANSGGQFFSATNAQELAEALTDALAATYPAQASGAAVALNSGALFNGSVLFQAKFDARDWSGQLDAYLIDTADGSIADTPDATFSIPDESIRNIATYGCDNQACEGLPFSLENGTADLDNYFLTSSLTTSLIDAVEVTAAKQDYAIAWLRGDTQYDDGVTYRSRGVANATPVGDIIHSSPVYVGSPVSPYFSWAVADDEYSSSYATFKAAQCTEHELACENVSTPRREMVYVGGNDGMLHMYQIEISEDGTSIDTAVEIGAYVPNAVIQERELNGSNSSLSELYDPDYAHRYYVDSTPTVGDAFINGDGTAGKEWQTVLVSGLRGGGKGIFAINITNPEALASSNVSGGLPSKIMWEFTDPDLGYTYSRPNIVRLPNGDWGVIFGNGYNGDSDDAILFVLDLETGAELARIHAPATAPSGVTYKNGLSTVAPVDLDGDHIVDYIYGGDLYGNVWRFEITGNTNNGNIDLDISYGGSPLFVAKGPNNDVQPITTRVQVTDHPTTYGGYMVYFGTGKYIEPTDREFPSSYSVIQSYYAIWDRDDGVTVNVQREHLLQQKILFEVEIQEDPNPIDGVRDTFDYRITSNNSMTWFNETGTPCNNDGCTIRDDKYIGWYMDLYNTENETVDESTPPNTLGERQVTDSVVRNDRVIFTTTVPDGNICGSSDYGWIMELDAKDGSRLVYTPFDVSGDGVFSLDDFYDVDGNDDPDDPSTLDDNIPVTGRKSKVGLLPTPGILSDYSDPTAGKEYKYMSGSTGKIESLQENPGSSNALRQSWKELRWDDMINFDNL